MTDNRISVFNQDVIPNVLRTKLIPQLEENEMKAYYAAKEFESVKTYDVRKMKGFLTFTLKIIKC